MPSTPFSYVGDALRASRSLVVMEPAVRSVTAYSAMRAIETRPSCVTRVKPLRAASFWSIESSVVLRSTTYSRRVSIALGYAAATLAMCAQSIAS